MHIQVNTYVKDKYGDMGLNLDFHVKYLQSLTTRL